MRRTTAAIGVGAVAIGVGLTGIGMGSVRGVCVVLWDLVAPGGKMHPAKFLEHEGHLFVEILLMIAILYLLFYPKTKPKDKDTLTEKVNRDYDSTRMSSLCRKWRSCVGNGRQRRLCQKISHQKTTNKISLSRGAGLSSDCV